MTPAFRVASWVNALAAYPVNSATVTHIPTFKATGGFVNQNTYASELDQRDDQQPTAEGKGYVTKVLDEAE